MIPFNIDNPRHKIIHTFSQWSALSATRSGCPIKSREAIYSLLNKVSFSEILQSRKRISREVFNEWHERNTIQLRKNSGKKMPIGWAVKVINVYLKSMVYLGQIGRPNLEKHIHPPVDSGLWEGLKERCQSYPEIRSKIYSKKRIGDIKKYQEYNTIIEGMRSIAGLDKCDLIELEKYWLGTKYKTRTGKRL